MKAEEMVLRFYLPAEWEHGLVGQEWILHTLDLGAHRSHQPDREAIVFVRLSDGRTIVTNLLDSPRRDGRGVSTLPSGSLTGTVLNVDYLLLSSKEERKSFLSNFEKNEGGQFRTPEGWNLAYYKVGDRDVVSFSGETELDGLEVDSGNLFVFYYRNESDLGRDTSAGETSLERIEEWVSSDFIGWTADETLQGPSSTWNVPSRRSSLYESYDDYRDYERDDEDFTPYTGYYSTGTGDRVFAFAGEDPDYTACDKECGYCGRCTY
jgi:hypothetical protein